MSENKIVAARVLVVPFLCLDSELKFALINSAIDVPGVYSLWTALHYGLHRL